MKEHGVLVLRYLSRCVYRILTRFVIMVLFVCMKVVASSLREHTGFFGTSSEYLPVVFFTNENNNYIQPG